MTGAEHVIDVDVGRVTMARGDMGALDGGDEDRLSDVTRTSAVRIASFPKAMRTFLEPYDLDGSGRIDRDELAQAITTMQMHRSQKRMAIVMLIVAAVALLLLTLSIFGMSALAAEAVKEVKVSGKDDSRLLSRSGDVVQVSSADFVVKPDGTLVVRMGRNEEDSDASSRRLSGAVVGAEGTIKTSAAEAPHRLSSTMAVDAYKELKYITLEDKDSGFALGVQVEGFRRERVRTSRCGSVVRLETPHGQITIDDYDVLVDKEFQAYAIRSGLGGLMKNGGLQAFGRRLSAASMLTGFFNSLPEGEWACDSQPLARPEEISGIFLAKARIRRKKDPKLSRKSKLFPDLDDNDEPLLTAGVEKVGDVYYEVWDEESVGGVLGTSTKLQRFPLYPMTDFLKFKVAGDGYSATLAIESGVVVNCSARGGPIFSNETIAEARRLNTSELAPTPPPRLFEFIDLVEADGIVLRHFRMDLRALSENQTVEAAANGSSLNVHWMMRQGMLPNMYDYYDVDTDPTGKRESGSPYRRVSWSTVASSNVWMEATYTSIERVDDNFSVSDILSLHGVSGVVEGCLGDLQFGFELEESSVLLPILQLKESLEAMTTMPEEHFPIQLPPSEFGVEIQRQREMLLDLDRDDDRLGWALEFKYWRFILKENTEEADDVLLKYSSGARNDTGIPNVSGAEEGRGELNGSAGEEGGEEAVAPGGRRLSSEGRRRQRKCSPETAKRPCFATDVTTWPPHRAGVEFSMNVPHGSRMFSLSVGMDFPDYKFEKLFIAAQGTDVLVGCVFGICAFVSGGGEISYSKTDRSSAPLEQNVWVQPSIGIGRPMFYLPKLILGVIFRHGRRALEVHEIYAEINQAIGLNVLAGGALEALVAIADFFLVQFEGSLWIRHAFSPQWKFNVWGEWEDCGWGFCSFFGCSSERYRQCKQRNRQISAWEPDYSRWTYKLKLGAELLIKGPGCWGCTHCWRGFWGRICHPWLCCGQVTYLDFEEEADIVSIDFQF